MAPLRAATRPQTRSEREALFNQRQVSVDVVVAALAVRASSIFGYVR